MSGARHARAQVCQEPGMSGIPDMSGTRCVRSGQVCQEPSIPGMSDARYSKDVLELGMSGVRYTYTLCQVQLLITLTV